MNKTFLKSLFVLTVITSTNFVSVFGQQADKIACAFFDDFETGELFGWETYPYAQDIAFDALYFTRDNPTYKGSRYALARPLRANDTNELEQGFTKQFNFWTTEETILRCAIYFQSDRNPETLEFSLGTFDGRRFFHTVTNPKANEWLELNIPVHSFQDKGKPLGAGENIQVVTIKGSYPVVSYLYTYTILMDDFRINGERHRRFVAMDPQSTDFDSFDLSILNKHFFAGDEISLNVAPEGNVSLREVRAKLTDGKGKIIKNNIRFTQSKGQWSSGNIHQVNAGDNRGQWKIELSGLTSEGKLLNGAFNFLVPVNRIDAHPRLFFSAEELKKRLENETSPVAKKILDNALKNKAFMKVDIDAVEENTDRTAENLVGRTYGKNPAGYNAIGAWTNPRYQLRDVIREGSFCYAFTGDIDAAHQAKKALLKFCSFSQWNNDWMLDRKFYTYYPVGYMLKSVAYGYDMLYGILTEEERKFVREAIMEKGLKLFYRDMVEMNRMPSQQTNHIAVIVAGYGLAATAIYGDDPGNPYLEPYISGIMAKAKAFLDHTYYADGSYAEPPGYMDMASSSVVEILAALERNFGVDYTTGTNVGAFYQYPLYATYDDGMIQVYGDEYRSYKGFTHLHSIWSVYRSGNPYLYNYLKPYWEKGAGGYMGYLWYRDDITPLSRNTLPKSRTFKAQGMVMRSAWDDRSTVITTHVGPNSNHYHYDQGSFQIMVNGEELFSDPGIGEAGYYGTDGFLSYDIQAIGHNVMLVDHDPESQNPAHYDNGVAALRDWPRMTQTFNSETVDCVQSDLISVYKGKLDVYNRTLLYNRGGTLFLFDRVKSKSPDGEVYDWLFHAPKNKDGVRSMNIVKNRLTVDRENARLTMDVLSPIENTSIRDRNDSKFPENFATFTSNENQRDICFFAAIVPEAKPETEDFYRRPETEKIESDRWIGAKVERTGGIDYAFFQKDENRTGASSLSGFTTDAPCFSASYDEDKQLKSIYLEGSLFTVNGFSLRSLWPLTCAVAFSPDGMTIETDSEKPADLTLTCRRKPTGITVNNQQIKAWKYDQNKQELTIKLQEGKLNISINTTGWQEEKRNMSINTTGWQEEIVDYEALSQWQLLGKGSVSPNMNVQTCLMESDDSQGVMLLSPTYYKGDVVVKYKALALTSASVFVTILSATDTDTQNLTVPEDYDGGMGLWMNAAANYFIAFKNAPHGATPFIVKNPGYRMSAKAAEQDKMLAGLYYDIEVGKEAGNLWLSIDGEKLLSWKDPSPIQGGHIAFRLRGTAGLKAAGLIKNLKIYSKEGI